MRRKFLLARGWRRLRRGFCPLCNSSPPVLACKVCLGNPKYGHELEPGLNKYWWRLFEQHLELMRRHK